MKEIIGGKRSKKGRGFITVVSDEDYEFLNQYNWHFVGGGYVGRSIKVDGKTKTIYMHTLIIPNKEGFVTDHIDGNKLNNQRENLRVVTQHQNTFNQIKRKAGMSKYKGVTFNPKINKSWRAYICDKGKYKAIGYYHTEAEAVEAYNAKAIELWGEYARPNELTL